MIWPMFGDNLPSMGFLLSSSPDCLNPHGT